MFYLHASNRTENLLLHLAKLIQADPLDSIFAKEYILIQSQGMERMISQYLAEYFTSWCNYRFLLPIAFLQDIAGKLGLEITPDVYERSFLCWRIEEKLRHIEDPVYTPLHPYLQGEQLEVKRFQLARKLANIFDQYQLMRPQLLRSWEKNKLVGIGTTEKWQMHIWNRLTAETASIPHRGELLHRVISTLSKAENINSMPKRVSIFGVHILPPFFLDYLRGLSKHCDIHLFLLSPCKNYWGDFHKKTIDADLGEEKSYHPLLVSLGQQGRVFQELLLEKIDVQQEFISYEDPCPSGKASLLNRLQADLLAGKLDNFDSNYANDTSIRIVSCHSRQRELEVLKDHILHLLDNDDALKLRDIVIMAPDIQEYAPLIPAVFDDIQHSIADRSLFRRNSHISAFGEFLKLFNGRFGWSEVLDLLEKEQIYRNFNIYQADFERLKHWILSAGIRWGLSAQSRERTGFAFSENCWQAGLDRMLMGYAIDSDVEVAGVYPYSDIEGGGASPLGGLCEFIDLLDRGVEDFSRNHTLGEWSQILLRYAQSLFGVVEERNSLELSDVLRQLSQFAAFHDGQVRFEVIVKWYERFSSESRSASGFLKGHLTFCSMLPMRSIPFKSVCLIGMNYGVFPASDGLSSFDLMKLLPQTGDRSLRADDRYQFLEVLLSARETLYISYVGQSQHTNDLLPPSVVVAELLEVLNSYHRDKDFIEHHPLHSFSKRYFLPDSNLFSYSEQDYCIAEKRCSPRVQRGRWWSGRIEVEQSEIDVAELFGFFSHPQRYFVQQSLGVSMHEEAAEPEESEPFESAGLQAYLVNQILLQDELENGGKQKLLERLCLDGIWPLGAPGKIVFGERKEEISHFADEVRALAVGNILEDLEIDLQICGYQVRGMLTNRHENGFLLIRYGNLRCKDLICAWLHHLLAISSGCSDATTTLMMKDCRVIFDCGISDGPALEELIKVYIRGKSEPSPLFLEPGLDYCYQLLSSRARISPLEKARSTYRNLLKNGYEPSWSLLYGELDETLVIDDAFAQMAEKILKPLLEHIR